MSQDRPPPPSPDAPPAAVTNDKVALALLAPPSPTLPVLHQRAGMANLFRDCVKIDDHKRLSNLPLMGFSHTKKKGGVKHAALGRVVFDRVASLIVLEIHLKRAMLMTVWIQTKKRMKTTHPLRHKSLFHSLRSQSPRIQRLPSTVITSHFFVP